MPNANQILFIAILIIIISISMIGIYYTISKSTLRKRELYDLEQRLQLQEQIHAKYLLEQEQKECVYSPVMVKQGLSTVVSPIVIMKPHKQEQKKTKRESILHKVYGFRNTTSSPPPTRPSSIRPPSFLPMKEHRLVSPPAYGDYHNSMPLDTK